MGGKSSGLGARRPVWFLSQVLLLHPLLFLKKIRYYFMYTFGQVKVTFLAYNSTSFDKHIQRCNHHHNQELFSSSLNPPGTFAVSPSLLTPRPWQPLSCFCVCWCGF